jgi:hypothetical protein
LGGIYEESYVVSRYGYGSIAQSFQLTYGNITFYLNVDGVGRVVSVT